VVNAQSSVPRRLWAHAGRGSRLPRSRPRRKIPTGGGGDDGGDLGEHEGSLIVRTVFLSVAADHGALVQLGGPRTASKTVCGRGGLCAAGIDVEMLQERFEAVGAR